MFVVEVLEDVARPVDVDMKTTDCSRDFVEGRRMDGWEDKGSVYGLMVYLWEVHDADSARLWRP
jgi:hypothetical protein